MANNLLLSPKYNLNLPNDKWNFGVGKLSSDGKKWSVYSKKNNKNINIFYEDIFISKDVAIDRIPSECLSLLDIKKNKYDFCKIKSTGSNDIKLIAKHLTTESNILKFRTIYINGLSEDELMSLLVPNEKQ